MGINESIFKAYDIRGLVPEDLTPEIAFRLGRAVVDFLGCKKVIVGMDMRDSSEELKQKLIEGITIQGTDVIDIGLCSTPMNYFANGTFKADASVMITASHNPNGWNGFKICRAKAVPLSGDTGIMDLKKLVVKNKFTEASEKGTVTKNQILTNYIDFIKGHYHNPAQKKLKVIFDCANAMGVYELKSLNLPGLEIMVIYDELDGNFPNHEANPLKHDTLKALQDLVLKEKADLGVAFDGDGDRCGMVDEKGYILRNDFIGALISEDLLGNDKGATIFYDLRSSRISKEIIEEFGGKPMMCRVGHAFIKEQMRQNNASFASELSGHYYFKENFNAESSALAVVRILNLMIKTNKKLSELSEKLKKYFQSGEINRTVDDKELVLNRIKEKYYDAEILNLDGISIIYDDWWANIRASNTEPLLRLNVEADSEELMEQKRDEILGLYD